MFLSPVRLTTRKRQTTSRTCPVNTVHRFVDFIVITREFFYNNMNITIVRRTSRVLLQFYSLSNHKHFFSRTFDIWLTRSVSVFADPNAASSTVLSVIRWRLLCRTGGVLCTYAVLSCSADYASRFFVLFRISWSVRVKYGTRPARSTSVDYWTIFSSAKWKRRSRLLLVPAFDDHDTTYSHTDAIFRTSFLPSTRRSLSSRRFTFRCCVHVPYKY